MADDTNPPPEFGDSPDTVTITAPVVTVNWALWGLAALVAYGLYCAMSEPDEWEADDED